MTMETPRVNPVGLVEVPEDYEASPRRFSGATRLFAGVFLLLFAAATLGTSIISLGAYCLTSDGGNTRALEESVQRWRAEPAAPPVHEH